MTANNNAQVTAAEEAALARRNTLYLASSRDTLYKDMAEILAGFVSAFDDPDREIVVNDIRLANLCSQEYDRLESLIKPGHLVGAALVEAQANSLQNMARSIEELQLENKVREEIAASKAEEIERLR